MKLSVKDLFSTCDQIRCFLRIWLHLLKKSLMKNFFFCTVEMGLIWVEKDNVLNLNSKELAERFDFYFYQNSTFPKKWSHKHTQDSHTWFCKHQIWGRSDHSKGTLWNVKGQDLTEKNLPTIHDCVSYFSRAVIVSWLETCSAKNSTICPCKL